MQAMDDMALLREYAASNSEEAFATLVTQHYRLPSFMLATKSPTHEIAK